MAGAEREHRNAHEIEHHRRNVHHIVCPVAPAGKKAVEVTENFLGPQIDAAFAGITMRQFDHRNSLRPEKQHQRDQPEPHGDSAVRGDARNYVEIEHRDDEQRDEIPAAERTLQMNRFGCGLRLDRPKELLVKLRNARRIRTSRALRERPEMCRRESPAAKLSGQP